MTFDLDGTRPKLARAQPPKRRPLSSFETAPAFLFYLPVAVWWGVLSLRYLSPTLPALANPAIAAGGLCGESKSGVLDILGPKGHAVMARFVTVTTGGTLAAEPVAEAARAAMAGAGITFPIVAKPDIGRNGRGVRKIDDIGALGRYLARYPEQTRVLLQEFSPWPGEAGIFYVRYPGETTGRITSVTLKYFPTVTGDGQATLRQLIKADPRAGQVTEFYFSRLGPRLDQVPAPGESVSLVFTGNHCQGAIFRDGGGEVTPAMSARFDAIAREIDGFWFGRFDLRYRSLEALKRGEDIAIIELNGAGSEATHIWDANMSLLGAYRVLFRQVRTAFEIGAAVRRRTGARPIGPIRLLRLYFSELSVMRRYPGN